MDFRRKNRIIVWLTLIVLLTLFLSLINYQESSFKTRKIDLYRFSTNELCSVISNYFYSNDLFKKNPMIDDIAERISNFNFGGIIKWMETEFDKLHSKTDNIIKNKKIQNFRNGYILLHTQQTRKPLFGITSTHSIFKLDKDCQNLPLPRKAINDYVCKGEWESIQIIIVPFTDTIKHLEVTISNIPLPAKDMQCFIGEYAYCRKNKFQAGNSGLIADPLITMDAVDSSKNSITFKSSMISTQIPDGETKSIWLNYYIPETTKAGNYTLTVAIKGSCQKEYDKQTTQINLKVFDYTLPKTMHLKNAFSFNGDAIKNYYNIATIPETTLKEYYKFLLDYHLNPISLYNPIQSPFPAIEDWQWCVDKGANYFNIGYLQYIPHDSINLQNKFKETLSKNIALLKRTRLLNYAFIYGFDEIKQQDYSQLKYMYKKLRTINKEIPFACTVGPNRNLSGFVNIWIPEIESFQENRKLHKTEKTWEYVCFTNKDIFPNFYIEYQAIDPRIIFWHCSKNSIDGFLYYCINNWIVFDTPKELQLEYKEVLKTKRCGTSWPEIPWIGHSYRINDGQRYVTGDGQLVYPGKNMKLYPSIRLINIRDGIEDYECFYQLKMRQHHFEKTGSKAKADSLKAFLVKAYEWTPLTKSETKNPDELLEIMKEARSLLERYSKY